MHPPNDGRPIASPALDAGRPTRDGALVREARRRLATYRRLADPGRTQGRRTAPATRATARATCALSLLDFVCRAAQVAEEDEGPRAVIRALEAWTREGLAVPALRRWIEAGRDAVLLLQIGYSPAPAGAASMNSTGELVRRGQAARERLITANLRLVVTVAKAYV